MKNILITIVAVLMVGCNNPDRGAIGNTAIKFSSIFVVENSGSDPSWKVEGKEILKNEGDSVYYVSGTVEGFSSYNEPIAIKKFNETLHFLGGDVNNRKNWNCIEINIDGKKIK